jgi:hypothetical protein
MSPWTKRFYDQYFGPWSFKNMFPKRIYNEHTIQFNSIVSKFEEIKIFWKKCFCRMCLVYHVPVDETLLSPVFWTMVIQKCVPGKNIQ